MALVWPARTIHLLPALSLPFAQGQAARQRRHLRVGLKTSEADPGASWDLGQRGQVCGTRVTTPEFMTQLCHKLAVALLPFYRIMVRQPLSLALL